MAYNVGSTISGGGSFGLGSNFSQILGNKNNVVPKPVTVKGPNRGDYGDPGPRPVIDRPTRSSYGMPAPGSGMPNTGMGRALHNSAAAFNDPTSTAAFRNLMNLESEQGAAVEGEVARSARDAASRAGYTGGFGARSRQAQQDRFQAIAEGGMAAASQIRQEAGDMHKAELEADTSRLNAMNAQTGESDRAFANDLAAAARGQGELDLGFGKLVQERNLSYAEARGEADRLQAQLDSAFQSQLIDAGRYNQISASLAAQLAAEQARMKEDARRFDLTRADQKQRDAMAQRELDRQRRERGVDPTTGQHYGPAYTPGQHLGGI